MNGFLNVYEAPIAKLTHLNGDSVAQRSIFAIQWIYESIEFMNISNILYIIRGRIEANKRRNHPVSPYMIV